MMSSFQSLHIGDHAAPTADVAEGAVNFRGNWDSSIAEPNHDLGKEDAPDIPGDKAKEAERKYREKRGESFSTPRESLEQAPLQNIVQRQ